MKTTPKNDHYPSLWFCPNCGKIGNEINYTEPAFERCIRCGYILTDEECKEVFGRERPKGSRYSNKW